MKKFLILALLLIPGMAHASVAGTVPMCDDPRLLQRVSEKVSEYHMDSQTQSVVGRREQAILLKEMQSFEEISSDNFTDKDDYQTAKRLIEIKINKNVPASDVRLCKNTGKGIASKVYLIVYAYRGGHHIAIVNLAKNEPNLETEY